MSWVRPPTPADETNRLEALRALEVLDSEPEESFDAIVRLAASICGVPIALVSLVDEHRQWFKARFGMGASETPRDVAFCAHAINEEGPMIVPSSGEDERFAENPLRIGEPNVEFYAGVPLRTASGHAVGTLCVIDHVPRELSEAQVRALEALATQVTRLLELRRAAAAQRATIASLRATEASLRGGMNSLPLSAAPRRLPWVYWAALCIAALSALLSVWVQTSLDENGRSRIDQAALRVEHVLHERLENYAVIVRSVAALYRASETVSADEFTEFAKSLDLQHNYAGLLGVGFVERVERAGLGAWLEATLAEAPDFNLRGEQGGDFLAVNRRLYPDAPNHAALGFDALSEPLRRDALLRADESGEVVMTPRLTLVQDNGPGFLLYAPARREHDGRFVGWALTVLRSRDLLDGLDDAAGPGIDLRIDDDLRAEPLLDGSSGGDALSTERTVRGANHTFKLTLSPGLGFHTISARSEAPIVLLLGVSAALLLAALGRAMQVTDERSRAIARRMTEALRRSENELRAVIDGTSDFVVTFDQEQRLVLVNRAFRETLGQAQAEAEGVRIGDVVERRHLAAFQREVDAVCASGGARRVETVFVSERGVAIPVEGTISMSAANDGGFAHAIFRDVTARKQAEQALLSANAALAELATTDALTGVANRRLFDERIADEVARSLRHGTPLSLVLIDVDHFKLYNDCYGHAAGDECLRKVAACIRSHARRSGELAARYGGEEFALILSGATMHMAVEHAERTREALAGLAIPHARHSLGHVTASFGVAELTGSVDSVEALIESADAALYRAKALGRHRVAC